MSALAREGIQKNESKTRDFQNGFIKDFALIKSLICAKTAKKCSIFAQIKCQERSLVDSQIVNARKPRKMQHFRANQVSRSCYGSCYSVDLACYRFSDRVTGRVTL